MANRCLMMAVGLVLSGAVVAQTPADHSADLAAIKDYALNYTAKLPNYTARQVVQRLDRPTQRGRFTVGPQSQKVEEQISYVDGRELHKILTVNGIAVKVEDSDSQFGMFSRGEFALLLSTIFRPETKTAFSYERTAKLDGRNMLVFEFQVPQLPNGYGIMEGSRTLLVPYKGSFFADAETKAVMRIQFACTNIPSDSQVRGMTLTLDYKPIQVAGKQFILPSHFTMYVKRVEADVSIESNYRDYQRFAADATIILDGEPNSVQ